ncbi:hypothetical protein LY78DRAFT_214010 [Colletotrichum sublineola]|nr:hypothetical protein LY78DRAFT_214010 [Colletotrichum sublineola]
MKFTVASVAAIAAVLASASLTDAASVNRHIRDVFPTAVNEGGFAATCKNFAITRRAFNANTYFDINARCETFSGRELDNRLQLGLCLSNDHGVLRWSKRGNFDKTCQNCNIRKIAKNEVKLGCWCEPAHDKTIIWAEINLNGRIRNANGQLWCGDEIGIAW